MGTVYKAIDPRLDRTVALKTVRLDARHPDYPDFRERFHAEAKSAGRLSHPNIVTIHDFGEVDNVAFIAMEYLRGETLRDMLDRQRFSVRRAVRYAMQIADGLAAAHADGVVHRDIKPANVLRLPNGLLKITDFGIAQVPTSQVTQAGTLLGTPKYMSPEQMRGMRVDRRSDIFSLGVVFYEMLTGTLPFGGASLSSVAYQIVHDQPIHPNRWNPAIPQALIRILAKCLEKDPDSRYQAVDDVARDLRQYKSQQVAIDADVQGVFLPLDPAAQALQSTPITKPIDGATQAWLSATLPLDQTQPLEPIRSENTVLAGVPRSFVPISARVAASLLLGAVVIFGAGLYSIRHNSAPQDAVALHPPGELVPPPAGTAAALAGEAPATTVANNTSSALTPVEVTSPPVAAVVATDMPDESAGEKKPDEPSTEKKVIKPALRKPKAAATSGVIESVPVVLSEPVVKDLPAAPAPAPGPDPAELAAKKRLQDEAAFKMSLKRERDCLVANRCE
jgi:serine/threonine protein kinase